MLQAGAWDTLEVIAGGEPRERHYTEDGEIKSFEPNAENYDRLCGLVVRVPGYRSRGAGSILGATTFSEMYWVWNGVQSV
jgi:hypothetical protein